MGSATLNNLEMAACEFRLAKTKDSPEERATILHKAAMLWNKSVPYCRGDSDQYAKLCRNLILVHVELATAAVEVSDAQTAIYHISELSSHALMRSKLLGEDEGTWAFSCKRLAQALTLRGVTAAMWVEVFWAFAQQCHYEPARVARSTALRLYLAKSFQRACVMVSDKAYSQLSHLFVFGRPKLGEALPEELQAWVSARQQVARAMVCLVDAKKEGLVDVPELAELTEEYVNSVVEQASFLCHRANVLLKLYGAYRLATEVFMEKESYQHHDALEVVDEFRSVAFVAVADGDAPSGLDGSIMDVEMTCIALYHLGCCYQRLGLSEQQAKCCRECIELSLSLDTSYAGTVDGLIGECSVPPRQLRTQPWFVSALDFLKRRQEAKKQEEQAIYKERIDRINEHVTKMMAIGDPASLVRHLYRAYKIPEKNCPVSEGAQEITKPQLFATLLTYAPDKQQSDRLPAGWALGFQSWHDFCTEATKRLTSIYELNFKAQ